MNIKIAACQVPDTREDIDKAISYINKYSLQADSEGVKLLCFPECFLQGYLVEEQAARSYAIDLDSSEFDDLINRLPHNGPMLVIGLIEKENGRLFNTAIVLKDRKLIGKYRKTHLLEGENIFDAGNEYPVFEIDGLRFGINICYDTNFPDTAQAIAAQNTDLIVCPANNMMRRKKADKFKKIHLQVRAEHARLSGLWLISSDVICETETHISYGTTSVINSDGIIISKLHEFEEGMVMAEVPVKMR